MEEQPKKIPVMTVGMPLKDYINVLKAFESPLYKRLGPRECAVSAMRGVMGKEVVEAALRINPTSIRIEVLADNNLEEVVKTEYFRIPEKD